MSVLTAFQSLGRMRKTGTMHVTLDGETLTFEFEKGCIQFAGSDRSPEAELLGELLVERGFCSPEALTPLLAIAASSNDKLGELVVQQKIVTNGQVLEALELQVQRRFERACASKNASYQFDEGPNSPNDGRIRITPLELAFEKKRGDRA